MCDSQSPAELVLTWAGPAVIGCQIGKDELFLPFGEPAYVLWIVDNDDERKEPNEDRGNALQQKEPLPIG